MQVTQILYNELLINYYFIKYLENRQITQKSIKWFFSTIHSSVIKFHNQFICLDTHSTL